MYEYLKGKIVSKQIKSYRGAYIVLDVNGVGYFITVGQNTAAKVEEGNDAKIYVSLVHREDAMNLIGFSTKEERDIFNILQSVSGIGSKTAVVILDEFSAAELIDIMIREDSKELSRAKGVGSKSAQKIILELKDKLLNWSEITPVDTDLIPGSSADTETVSEVQSVLISLGYSAEESKNAIKEVLNRKKDCNKTEDILKYTLEYLSRNE